MRVIAWALLLLCSFAVTAGREPAGRVIEVSTAEELMAAFREPLENVTVKLAPGAYGLLPVSDFDSPMSKYCGENATVFPVTIGLTITGKNVRLVGPGTGEAVLVTNATYGLFFKNCSDCELERVTVTGTQLEDGATSDYGAIVAKSSDVRIANCVIDYNADDSHWRTATTLPVGICARDGADLVIEFNEMTGNSAAASLFFGSRAIIRNNLFVPMDTTAYGGGIELSCNAIATVERNHFAGSSGVKMTGQGELVCRGNLFEMGPLAVGLQATHELRAIIEKNTVYKYHKGLQIQGRVLGRASSNMLVENEIGLFAPGLSAEFEMRGNTMYNNSMNVDSLGGGGSREMFWRARRQWTRTYRNTAVGVDGRHKFYESAFLTRYGKWLN